MSASLLSGVERECSYNMIDRLFSIENSYASLVSFWNYCHLAIMRRFAPLLALAGVALAACNGRDEYCGRKYSDITYMGAHDSAFVGELPTHNQYVSITDQLNLGVRFLQAQTHNKGGAIEMCHTYCWELDEGTLDKYLQELAAWMKAHPNEVVSLLLTNGDKIPVETFDTAFAGAGLTDLVLHPKKVMAKDEWPTLQEMIDASTRLVVFMGAS